MQAQPGDEPCEAQYTDDTHHERQAHSLAAQGWSGGVASNTLPLRHGSIRLASIKAEGEASVDAQVAGLGDITHLGIGVLNDEGVELGKQRVLVIVLLLAGVPGEVGAGSEGHVGGKFPSRASLGAASNDIDSRGCAAERCVVPGPFDLVADLVELS